jgi:sugar phosphate isomerase/epimerase
MNIQYFCPLWGNNLPFNTFCKNVRKAGYDGVEMDLPLNKRERKDVLNVLQGNGLLLIGQYWQSLETDFKKNKESFHRYLDNLIESNPVKLNCQTGKDYFSFEQNMQLVKLCRKLSEQSGLTICHETHRGKFLFSLPVMIQAIKADPEIRITFDASHWCNVHESLLEDQEPALKKAIKATDHIHSRVGFQEGPQINDPRAPEWSGTVNRFFSWWDQIVAIHNKNKTQLTVTAEFGPAPYMPLKPYSLKPLSKQWDVNLHMVRLFKERYPNS